MTKFLRIEYRGGHVAILDKTAEYFPAREAAYDEKSLRECIEQIKTNEGDSTAEREALIMLMFAKRQNSPPAESEATT